MSAPVPHETAYRRKLDRVLDRMGGVYSWRDIEDALADGRMQSFAHGNSFLVTQITQFPRAKALDWIAAVGDLDDCRVIHDEAIAFADKMNISLIRAYGRKGWLRVAKPGWRTLTVNQLYVREL